MLEVSHALSYVQKKKIKNFIIALRLALMTSLQTSTENLVLKACFHVPWIL